MSDSNRVETSFARESTWGTVVTGAYTELLVTSSAFRQGTRTVRSQQIRTDAQQADAKRVGADPNITHNIEWSYGAFDELLRGGIRSDSDWSTSATTSATDISAASSGNQFTRASGDWTTENIAANQWIFVAGFSNAANNGWFKVTTLAATALTVAGATLVDETPGTTVTMKGSYIRNGTDTPSYSLVEDFQDLPGANNFHQSTGNRIGGWTMNIAPEAIITGGFEFQGKDFTQVTSHPGTVSAAAGNDVVSEVDGFDSVWIDNSVVSFDPVSLSLSCATVTRPQGQLGSLAKRGIGLGTVSVTAALETYLDDDSWSEEANYLAFTKFSLAWAFNDGNGNRYHFELPQVVYSDEPGERPGIDNDVMLAYSLEAEPGGTIDKTLQITRVAA